MILGRWPRKKFFMVTRYGASVAVAALVLLVSGCGGGGGGGPEPPPPTGNVVVRGRIIEGATSQPIGGATITYGSNTTTSDGNGEFRIEVPAPSSAQTVRVTGPDGPDPDTESDYYNVGQYQGQTYSLTTVGIAVPASAVGATFDFRPIRLFSKDGPPPPPSLD